jgi:polyisoprenoid-binding protein YceI
MSHKLLYAAALLAALVAPAAAQDAPNFDPAKVEAGSYAVEPNHTRVLFSVSHMGFTTWYGEFTHVSGTLTLPAKGVAFSALDIEIPTATVSTSNAVLDGELKDAGWFDAAAYPEIRFTATKVTRTANDTADVAGVLTFHGVARPVVLKAKFNASGVNPLDKKYTVGFEVSGAIKRSDFGVTKYVPLVGDDVVLIVSAAFEKM